VAVFWFSPYLGWAAVFHSTRTQFAQSGSVFANIGRARDWPWRPWVGFATRAFNERVVAQALEHAREKRWLPGTPYLIPPVERVLDFPRRVWFRPEEVYQPIELPSLVCLASFESWSPGRIEDPEANADGSQWNVVWFPPEFALPIDEGGLAAFRTLDWAAHATNFLY
jgi:hypothetical protein